MLLHYIKFPILLVSKTKLSLHLSLSPYIRPVFGVSIYGNREQPDCTFWPSAWLEDGQIRVHLRSLFLILQEREYGQ